MAPNSLPAPPPATEAELIIREIVWRIRVGMPTRFLENRLSYLNYKQEKVH